MEKWKPNIQDVTVPRNGYTVYSGNYWLCVDGDPCKALFYGTSPQCNRDKRIGDHMINSDAYGEYSGKLQIVFIENAFVKPID